MSQELSKEIKNWALEQAILITRDAVRGGHTRPDVALKQSYTTLVELQQQVESSD